MAIEELKNLNLTPIQELHTIKYSQLSKIKVQGFVSTIRTKGQRAFLILRSALTTIQCTATKNSQETDFVDELTFNTISKISTESFVEIEGLLVQVPFPINACTIKDLELIIHSINIISMAKELPFNLKDVSAAENPNFAKVGYSKCLDSRTLDLRTNHSYSIFKVIDCVMFSFRDFLRKKDFLEIKTPKLIGGASEGGANCFVVDYFKRKACLAQSPQLYKQMAVIGGLKRVYEIGHVYRAEESNINRYLSEFVGLDLEMEISLSFTEAMLLIYEMIVHIFKQIESECQQHLNYIKLHRNFENLVYPDNPVIYTYEECVSLLIENSIKMNPTDDFNRENEKLLGELIKKKDNTDIFIITKYPTKVRAFYTKPDGKNPLISNSFDFIIRGEEVLSGAQRIHDYDELIESVKGANINLESLKGYLESFKYGVPKHAGCGIGLERLVKAYFGFGDIRYFNMFPREPSRLYP